MALVLGTFSTITLPANTEPAGYTKSSTTNYIFTIDTTTRTSGRYADYLISSSSLDFTSPAGTQVRQGDRYAPNDHGLVLDITNDTTSSVLYSVDAFPTTFFQITALTGSTRTSQFAAYLNNPLNKGIAYNSDTNTLSIVQGNGQSIAIWQYEPAIQTTSLGQQFPGYRRTNTVSLDNTGSSLTIRGAAYDSTNNRYYVARSGTSTSVAGVIQAYDYNPTTNALTRNSSEDVPVTAAQGRLYGLYWDGSTLHILHHGASGVGITTAAAVVNVAPTISSAIPDQSIPATTTITIDLNDVFDGTPDPTYSITSGDTDWISISGSTLSISPQAANVRAAVYPVSITATNSEGSIVDTFNITVTAAPPQATAVITSRVDANAESVIFSIVWSNVTDYAGFTNDDISESVTGTRQSSQLSSRSNNTYTYTVYPTADTNGSAQITIAANAFDNPPSGGNNEATSSAVVSYQFAPLPAGSQYRITIPIPNNEAGTIHVAMKPRIVSADMVLGPDTESYLGSFQFDRTVIPDLIRIDRPDNLSTGDNIVLLDWNTEVKGVADDQFYYDGIPNITAVTATVFFAATGNPDVRPDADARSTAVITTGNMPTRAKYYKLVINIPDDTPLTGSLDIYIRSDTSITNDM